MISLLAKELRQLLPITALWMAVLVLGYGMQFFTERTDEQTFGSWCEGYCDYGSNVGVAVFLVLMALVTAYSLFPRELDDSTIDFLRALPVSAASVFVAKFLAAWILLCGVNLLSYGIDRALLASNPESIGGRFYDQVWLTLLWRDCLFLFIVLAHGVLLSWFRTLGLLFYSLYLIGLMWAESALGSSGNWSIFSLLSNQYEGSRLIVNQQGLVVHVGVALLLLLLAFRLWSRSDSSSSGGRRTGRGMKLLNAFLSLLGFALLGLFMIYRIGVDTGTAQTDELAVTATEHYRFVYDVRREPVVQYIVDHAESDLEALGEILGVETLPNIRVDLSANSEHAAGLAKWKKIQMDLDAFREDASQRRVLSHETTHVLQATESNRSLADNYSAARFFIEGMAQYTSFAIVPEVQRRRSNWELASVAWKRQTIRFDDLIDADGFASQYDAELHYSLGDLWTRAMVSTCGLSSLGDFLRATGREGAVRDLPAAIFWRDTMRAIDCDLDTLNATWRAQMNEQYESVDASRFPIYSDIVVEAEQGGDQVRVTARLAPYEDDNGATFAVEFGLDAVSDEADSADGDNSATVDESEPSDTGTLKIPHRFMIRVEAISTQLAPAVDPVFRGQLLGEGDEQRVQFVVPAYAVPGLRFRYQLGYAPSAESRFYYERWRRAAAGASAGGS